MVCSLNGNFFTMPTATVWHMHRACARRSERRSERHKQRANYHDQKNENTPGVINCTHIRLIYSLFEFIDGSFKNSLNQHP